MYNYGYVMLDLGGANLTTATQTIPGLFKAIQQAYMTHKPVIVHNYTLAGAESPASYTPIPVSVSMSGASYRVIALHYQSIVTSTDVVATTDLNA